MEDKEEEEEVEEGKRMRNNPQMLIEFATRNSDPLRAVRVDLITDHPSHIELDWSVVFLSSYCSTTLLCIKRA